jgi:hypothetical protein
VLIVFKETTVMKLKFLFTSVSILGLCAFSPSSIFASEQENVERSDSAPRPSSSIAQEEKGKEKEAADSHSTFSGITSEDVTRFVEDPTLWNNKNLNGHPIMGRYAEETDIAALIDHLTGSAENNPKQAYVILAMIAQVYESSILKEQPVQQAFRTLNTLLIGKFQSLLTKAEDGDHEAMFLAGHGLRSRLGPEVNPPETKRLWRQFATYASFQQLMAIGEEFFNPSPLVFTNMQQKYRPDLEMAVEFFSLAENKAAKNDLYDSLMYNMITRPLSLLKVEKDDTSVTLSSIINNSTRLNHGKGEYGKAFSRKIEVLTEAKQYTKLFGIFFEALENELDRPERENASNYFLERIVGSEFGPSVYSKVKNSTWKEQEGVNEIYLITHLLKLKDKIPFIQDIALALIEDSIKVRTEDGLKLGEHIKQYNAWLISAPKEDMSHFGVRSYTVHPASSDLNSALEFYKARVKALCELKGKMIPSNSKK